MNVGGFIVPAKVIQQRASHFLYVQSLNIARWGFEYAGGQPTDNFKWI